MSEVIITVRGEDETRIAPERATAHVTVAGHGPDRQEVMDQVLRLSEPVRDSISSRADGGPVAEWTSQRLSVSSQRPSSSDGKRLAVVHRASIDFTATFTDSSELSLWTTEISAWDGVQIGWVHWHLTPATRARVEQEVAASAVRVAIARARAYAAALELTDVVPLEIADQGLITSQHDMPAAPVAFAAKAMRAGAAASESAMEFRADDITVSATVEGRFRAS